jgi:death-on-curing family protein
MKKKTTRNDFPKGEIVIYKTKDGQAKLEVNLRDETLWLTQKQIAELFGIERSVITKHLKNIFRDGELNENSVCAIFAHTAEDGKIYQTQYYNLDSIISVGYRANSKRATQFRIWATNVLRNHLLKGFTINEKRLKNHRAKLSELEKAVQLLQKAMNSKKLLKSEAEGLLKVITDYANSWLLLQKYDEGKLATQKRISRISEELSYEDAKKSIAQLKTNLIKKKNATEIFGQERGHGLEAIIGNLNQSFGGKKLYPGVETKAAHLLYFVIKDHPFVDGNKRSAALLFVQFLSRNNFLFRQNGERKINDNTLVALALLVAQSHPKEKDVMVALITNLLQ